MLIKEYHILLPMSLDEYQVAQLYMIQKKSREESSGEGSGVEILANRPYTDGPGGSGQYTHKVYHVGSHIPGWFRALLPKAALQVEEESWNAYPYTRTRYTCPFVEKFSIEIETYYLPDGGQQPNVFNLSGAERRQRILDTIDIVRDAVAPGEYKAEEDPRLYRSVKTGRGPLTDDWARTAAKTGPLMCAYKLCKVEFRYWGMQAKIEQFIHDVGLRRVMLRAHRQAWCWQDEWTELSMADIRALEEETARMLAQRMAKCNIGSEGPEAQPPGKPNTENRSGASSAGTPDGPEAPAGPDASPDASFGKQWSSSSRSSYSSQHGGGVSPQSLSEWRMQNIARDSENSSEDEFFDAHVTHPPVPSEGFSDSDEVFPKEMTKWNSNDFIDAFASPTEAEGTPDPGVEATKDIEDRARVPRDSEGPDGAGDLGAEACAVHALFLILHSGNILDSGPGDANSKQADVQTLSSSFEAVTRIHFPEALGHVALRLVPCPPICAAAYALVSNLSPYSHDGDSLSRSQDHIPLAALPLLATSSSRYQGAVATVIARTNQAYAAFLRSSEGAGFCGQVVLIGDGVGGILGFDALCHSANVGTGSRGSSRRGSMNNELLSPEVGPARDPLADGAETLGRASPEPSALLAQRTPSDTASSEPEGSQNSLQAVPALTSSGEPRRPSTASCPPAASSEAPEGPTNAARLDFKVSGFFLFGSPLGLVLALRKTVMPALEVAQMRPACEQIYNLFHAADPCASRLEPLLAPKFQAIAPLAVPRYQKFPLGDGSSLLLADTLQTHSGLFLEELEMMVPSTPTSASGAFWKGSELGTEPAAQPAAPSTTSEVVRILERWWGTKRIDYSLYCPEALTAFPTVTLPHLFHASYWESADVVAFILRQVIEKERPQLAECEEPSIYSPAFPREKWQRKRTQVKIRNVTSNHRASDTVVCEGRPQVLNGRFMYGPLDVVTLTGEKVDVYVMTQPLSGKWIHFGTEVTNSSGRLTFLVPSERALGIGVYPVRMVVRGDHTYAECCLTVVARGTEAVVFSIDGSFTASVSIMGSDPKVRAGAVDVVRHWQDAGYLIVYVTGRPDMQKHRVVAWLSQHNFPHGVVSFCDGLTHDPLRQKAMFLQSLVQEVELNIVAGYGSPKDVAVYAALGLSPSQTYIVGRAVRKLQAQCQFLSDGYVAHLGQLEAGSHSHAPSGPPRTALAKSSYGVAAPVDFLRKQSQLLRSRGPSQAEREGPGTPPTTLARGKARSISLKLDSEE
ncbi:membrane-associated phosphatidylinositol transfer protein 1 isoform X1 [Marmota marmota marmota]|uniref:membrane-associated phosphatidylinositol transfer protein 1 isoform X1 n=1 Tax=Marmota marmota marmota TaxID=9994 RepID=UPI0020922F98|nr:membrane-associated phosphatidylinositol transfer protein 1 isoform X1 [Marmota marmota marmota]XP_048663698.1 membrane-associated phosphatidylinositol transfer protein 1 isoform X1 [Marmota marmota marmota]XP_048663699.1 membrane-associated phosphatidylinositol transfer protein 1 isoform X1 [Marmota marmota marmota]